MQRPPSAAPGTRTTSTAQKLAIAFSGQPLHLEHGPSNRLVLSLASGLPQELDFALERLLRVSQLDPTLLPLDLLPGLVESLCDVIDAHPLSAPSAARSHKLGLSPAAKVALRHATDAAIVLRNLAGEPQNLLFLWSRSQVLATVLTVLQQTAPRDASVPSSADLAQDCAQLRLVLLDVLAVYAPHISLSGSAPSQSTQDNSGDDESEEQQQKKALQLPPLSKDLTPLVQQIYPLVVQLCWSSDRAFILAAYYILAALATTANASTFTFPCDNDVTSDAPSNPVIRAIQLLPLHDMELISATLQFLFCYSDISSKNADSLASRSDVHHVLKMLLSKSMFGGIRQDYIIGPSKKQKMEALRNLPSGPGILPPAELRLLAALDEPQRTTFWCRWMYTPKRESEIQQIALWQAYKSHFASLNIEGSPTLHPNEFINVLRTTFQNDVQVTQTEVGTFVVRGLQHRDRHELVPTVRNYWAQHGAPPYLKGDPKTLPDEQLLLAALKGLIPPQLQDASLDSPGGTYAQDLKHSTWQPKTVDHHPAGHALYAMLVLRNLSRAVRSAVAPVQRSQGDQVLSYLTPFGETDDDPTDTFVHGAGQAADALLQMEEDLLLLACGARALSPYLSEILSDISAIRKKQATSINARAQQQAPPAT